MLEHQQSAIRRRSSLASSRIICNYLAWSMVHSMVSYLSEPFREASKVLRKALMGSDGSDTAWRYCVTDTNAVIGFALGAMFVREVFDGDSKPLVSFLLASFLPEHGGGFGFLEGCFCHVAFLTSHIVTAGSDQRHLE